MRIDAAQTVQFPSEYLDGFGHPIFSGYYTLADLTHKYGVDSSIYTTTVNGANAAVSKYANFDAVKLDTHLGEQPLKLRDPKFYTARTKRAVNSGGAL